MSAPVSYTLSAAPGVLLCAHRLPEAQLAEVKAAVVASRAAPSVWSGGQALGAPAGTRLVIAGLEPGERRVPDDLVELLTQRLPDAKLLLLSREPMVRHCISVQGGRVMLLAPPLSAQILSSRIRMILAAERLEDAASFTEGPDMRRELAGPHFWVGTVGRAAPGGARAQPVLSLGEAEGITAILPTVPDLRLLDEELTQIRDVLRRSDAEPEPRALLEAVGPRAGILQLNAAGDDLFCYWPDPGLPLYIHSFQRLPELFALSRTVEQTGQPLFRLAVSPGDILIACTGPQWSSQPGAGLAVERAALDAALAAGGPAVASVLAQSFEEGDLTSTALVVEVR